MSFFAAIVFFSGIDQDVLGWFQAHHSAGLNLVMVNLNDLGQRYVVTLVALLGVAWFLVRRQVCTALVILLATLLAWGLVDGIKLAVQRPRPDVPHVQQKSLLNPLLKEKEFAVAHSYSFPSGHALTTTAIYGTLALVVAWRLRRRGPRIALLAGVGVLVLVIGITRLYLGAHYCSDVLAGWLGGLGVALLCGWLDQKWSAGRSPDPVTCPRR